MTAISCKVEAIADTSGVFLRPTPLSILLSTLSELIKKLQLTVETEGRGDGTLKDETGGGAASGLNTSHLPPRRESFWTTDPQIRDSVKSILPHAHQRCVCHFPTISIRLGVLIEHQPALTSLLLMTHYEKDILAAAALMEFHLKLLLF